MRVNVLRGRWFALMAVAALTLMTIGVFSIPIYTPNYAYTQGNYIGSCKSTPGYITILADSHGYNDSIAHGAPTNPWPVIDAHVGDVLKLTFCNLDSVEAHGFAIDAYFDRGIILGPGGAYQISFRATQSGSFRIFCTNFCTVHKYMSGSLRVT